MVCRIRRRRPATPVDVDVGQQTPGPPRPAPGPGRRRVRQRRPASRGVGRRRSAWSDWPPRSDCPSPVHHSPTCTATTVISSPTSSAMPVRTSRADRSGSVDLRAGRPVRDGAPRRRHGQPARLGRRLARIGRTDPARPEPMAVPRSEPTVGRRRCTTEPVTGRASTAPSAAAVLTRSDRSSRASDPPRRAPAPVRTPKSIGAGAGESGSARPATFGGARPPIRVGVQHRPHQLDSSAGPASSGRSGQTPAADCTSTSAGSSAGQADRPVRQHNATDPRENTSAARVTGRRAVQALAPHHLRGHVPAAPPAVPSFSSATTRLTASAPSSGRPWPSNQTASGADSAVPDPGSVRRGQGGCQRDQHGQGLRRP